jgi:hypothetical protein
MAMNNKVIIGPFPPPYHGSSILAKELSQKLHTRKIQSSILTQKNIFFALINLFSSILMLKEKKVIIFTASRLLGKIRDTLIIFLLLFRKRNVFVYIHNNPFYDESFFGRILFFFSKYLTSIFSYESNEYNYLKKHNRNIKIIYNMIPDEELIVEKTEKKKSSKKIKFIICSHIIEFKNVENSIELVVKSNLNYTIDVIGSYNSNYGMKVFQKYKNSPNINFHGEVYGNKKIQLLKNSDILIHLSLNEEFPLIQIECLGIGLPFISYINVGGIKQVLSKRIGNLFLHEINYLNEKTFGVVIKNILLAKNIAPEMQEIFQKNFSTDRMIKEFKKLGFV